MNDHNDDYKNEYKAGWKDYKNMAIGGVIAFIVVNFLFFLASNT